MSLPVASQPRPAARPGALSEVSDEELARALVENCPQAHRVAWQRYSPMVRAMVHRVNGRGQDTEDVIQEIFLCLYRRVPTLRDPKALRAFVMAITTRTLSFELRKRRARQRLAGTGSDEPFETLRANVNPAAQHGLLALRGLVGRLRQRDQRAFVLRYVEGRNADEVAQVLGVSAPTARRSFARAWRRINTWASSNPALVDFVRQP